MMERTNREEETSSNTDLELSEPPLYRVLLHNDHYTTMEFVIEVLEKIFHKTASEATGIMLAVHQSGVGLCGVYPFEIAETRVRLVEKHARDCGFPLLCTMEEV